MTGDVASERETAEPPAVSLIDRELLDRDLTRLSALLTTVIMANLANARTVRARVKWGPLSRAVPVGELAFAQLRDYLPATISAALAGLRDLPDGELRGLCAVTAAELGAWCRAGVPLTDEQLSAGAPALTSLLGGGDGAPTWPDFDLDLGRLFK